MQPRPAADSVGAQRLLPLIGGQLCFHGSMAGVRLAAPLAVLQAGGSAFAAGLLLALFAAAPIVLALRAGRMVDRHGVHRPLRVAVAMTAGGAALAALAMLLPAGASRYGLLGLAAVCSGGGANIGMIAIQRTVGRLAHDGTELKRMFSWLGLAPAFSNMIGPVLAGVLIDAAGHGAAFAALALLALAALLSMRRIPGEAAAAGDAAGRGRTAWDLLATPAMRQLLLVNWLLSSSWDVHSFAIPVLGHERGLSASAIGLVLGVFSAAVAGVRLLIPLLAHRLREGQVLAGSMLTVAAVFAIYPLARSAPPMMACAAVLGLALGAVQPMIMATLHQITPEGRQGEAIALRSMAINLSSATMPLGFGLLGASLGAASLFWLMGAAVGAGSWVGRRVGAGAAPPAQ